MPQVKGAPTPHDEDPYISDLEEKVLALLEDEGVSESHCDAIMKILQQELADRACYDAETRASRGADGNG